MTTTPDAPDVTVTDETEPTVEEFEAFQREAVLEDADHVSPDDYPALWNASAGFIYEVILRAEAPQPPEYVTVPLNRGEDIKLSLGVSEWNLLWEAAQFRRRMFDHRELPAKLRKVADRGDANVVFVPRTKSRYYEYAPLYHLLPRRTVERFGLPLLCRGQWPFMVQAAPVDRYLPTDFETRLSRAWGAEVWRHLMPGSGIGGFSGSDPIRLLAHNLDFWLPPVTEVMQEVLRTLPVVDKGVVDGPPLLEDGTFLEGAVMANPRMGSDLWRGEEEAADTVTWVVEQADADGRLRAILDAVRSNRVEEDFSPRWTFAREDFERKLYRKRAKVQVRFVELTDTIPVQGPESEVVEHMVYGDFLALLSPRDRQIVVLLRSGVTTLTDVARIMGYGSHSAVSKRLQRIRREAARFFDEQ